MPKKVLVLSGYTHTPTNRKELQKHVLTPAGIDKDDVIYYTITPSKGKNPSKADIQEALEYSDLRDTLQSHDFAFILTTHGELFKRLVGVTQVGKTLGNALPLKGFKVPTEMSLPEVFYAYSPATYFASTQNKERNENIVIPAIKSAYINGVYEQTPLVKLTQDKEIYLIDLYDAYDDIPKQRLTYRRAKRFVDLGLVGESILDSINFTNPPTQSLFNAYITDSGSTITSTCVTATTMYVESVFKAAVNLMYQCYVKEYDPKLSTFEIGERALKALNNHSLKNIESPVKLDSSLIARAQLESIYIMDSFQEMINKVMGGDYDYSNNCYRCFTHLPTMLPMLDRAIQRLIEANIADPYLLDINYPDNGQLPIALFVQMQLFKEPGDSPIILHSKNSNHISVFDLLILYRYITQSKKLFIDVETASLQHVNNDVLSGSITVDDGKTFVFYKSRIKASERNYSPKRQNIHHPFTNISNTSQNCRPQATIPTIATGYDAKSTIHDSYPFTGIPTLPEEFRDCKHKVVNTVSTYNDSSTINYYSKLIDSKDSKGKAVKHTSNVFRGFSNINIANTLFACMYNSGDAKLIFHNATFDLKHIMWPAVLNTDYSKIEDPRVYPIMRDICRRSHDTALLAYLSLNSPEETSYSLKSLAQKAFGNYQLAEEDIKDMITYMDKNLGKALIYNATDTLATQYVYEEYSQKVVEEDQLDVYERIFQPSIFTLMVTELVGMPIDIERVTEIAEHLHDIKFNHTQSIACNPIILGFQEYLTKRAFDIAHSKWKTKKIPYEEFPKEEFNPNSDKQLQLLLYDVLELPVIDITKKGAPSTSQKTLKKLKNHTQDADVLLLLNDLIELAKVSIILQNFIKAFITNSVTFVSIGFNDKEEPFVDKTVTRLFGNFNLGGTVSGRLSSSNPNLQNIPSGSTYAKLIKSAFISTDEYIFSGADYNSLEDYVSALTTRDPNKLKVYIGHTIYQLTVNDTIHHIRDDATIIYDGKSYTGEEFYAAYTNGTL
jgi:hypothetical protein